MRLIYPLVCTVLLIFRMHEDWFFAVMKGGKLKYEYEAYSQYRGTVSGDEIGCMLNMWMQFVHHRRPYRMFC
jgi:uncharacterized Fe-S cluster-containing radical SAM superfamily protein